MEKSASSNPIANDVLHIPSQTQLSPEEIAKAIAHHKRHHHDEPPTPAVKPGKKNK